MNHIEAVISAGIGQMRAAPGDILVLRVPDDATRLDIEYLTSMATAAIKEAGPNVAVLVIPSGVSLTTMNVEDLPADFIRAVAEFDTSRKESLDVRR